MTSTTPCFPPSFLKCFTNGSEKTLVLYMMEHGDHKNILEQSSSKTLLHLCIIYRFIRLLNYLIKIGANLDAIDGDGNTPLHLAVLMNNNLFVKLLFEAGASVDILSNEHKTPLSIAIEMRNPRIYNMILPRANVSIILDDNKSSYLNKAVTTSDEKLCERLIEMGANLNFQRMPGTLPPLFNAIYIRNIRIFEMLLKAGSNINITNNNGETPLSYCSSLGATDFCELLLKYGPNVNIAKTVTGHTPLFIAVFNDNADIVKMLINAKCDVNQPDITTGLTPLMQSCITGNKEICKMLLEAGADVKRSAYNMNAPSNLACYMGDVDILDLLGAKKAALNIPTSVQPEHALFYSFVKAYQFENAKELVLDGGSYDPKYIQDAIPGKHFKQFTKFVTHHRQTLDSSILILLLCSRRFDHGSVWYEFPLDIFKKIMINAGLGFVFLNDPYKQFVKKRRVEGE